jgi:5-(carboxyamino)imidazole ribonucleotide synthase
MATKNDFRQILPGATIGILGEGQLGRMLALKAAQLGYKTIIYGDKPTGCAYDVTNRSFTGSYDPAKDSKKLTEFANACDVITLEFENIPTGTIDFLSSLTLVAPGAHVLEITQDRWLEKEFCREMNIPTTPTYKIDSETDLASIDPKHFPGRLKTRRMGYDGKGQYRVSNKKELMEIYRQSQKNGPTAMVFEKEVSLQYECSVIFGRHPNDLCENLAVVKNVHRDGILFETTYFAREINESERRRAEFTALRIARGLNVIGLIAVEMFMDTDGNLLVNELAPRPHNSGHWSMNACDIDQYELLIRCICSLPSRKPSPLFPKAVMTNLLGNDINTHDHGTLDQYTFFHNYGKGAPLPGRKMGHITTVFPNY